MRFAAVAGVIVGLLTAVPAPASAEGDRAAASSAAGWLAAQLSPDGTLQNPLGGELPDHGLMIDTLFAAHAAGRPDLAQPIVRFLDDQRHATDYYTWDGLVPGQGYDAIITAGATAKVLVAAEVAGRNPRTFGGHDMVAETLGTIRRSGPDKGRVSDYSKNPDFADFVTDNSNMFGQALAVIGLAGAGRNDQLAIDTLLTQQCSEGYFRIFFGHDTANTRITTCDEGKRTKTSTPDGDTTGLALSAVLAARSAGAKDLDGPIVRARNWLKTHQTASGGWGGGVGTEAPNTNSTGLIVQALAEAGCAGAEVARGTAFLTSAQANVQADKGNALHGQIGAIAYTPADYQAARASGIGSVDTWIRAGAQATLGLAQVGFHDLTLHRRPKPQAPQPPCESPRSETPPAPPAPQHPAGPPSIPPASTPATPPAAAPQPAATRFGAYLASKLVGGDHVEITQDGKPYVDYDLTADLVLALRTLGGQDEAATRATRFLLTPASIDAYAHGVPYEKAAYAEPLAKLSIIARFQQAAGDATIDQLRTELAGLRTRGEFTDTGTYGDQGRTVTRQAWVAMATTAAGDRAGAEAALAPLTTFRCADGLLPHDLVTTRCATGDLAATAAGVMAMATQSPGAAQLARALDARPGVLTGSGGAPDFALTGSVTAGRAAAGLGTSTTTAAVTALVRPDGSLSGDLAADIAAAPAVAGHGWLEAAGSPLAAVPWTPAVASSAVSGAPATFATAWLLVRGGGAALLLLLGTGFLITRKKGATP